MELTNLIKTKIKQNKVTFGYKNVIKLTKTQKPELIIIVKNFPKDKRRILEYNAKISKIEIKEYSDDGINLGLLCGKPFPISVLAIKRSKK